MKEEKTDKPQWKPTWKDRILSSVAGVLFLFQIVLCFFFYNSAGLDVILYVGWIILWVSAVFGWISIFILRRKGRVPKGKSYVPSPWKPRTTVLVDSGIYAIVRHPQYLAGIFFSFAIILIAQHWLIMIISVAAMVSTYGFTRQADRGCVEKFGDAYKRYMKSVPRMNLLVGVIRLARRRKRE